VLFFGLMASELALILGPSTPPAGGAGSTLSAAPTAGASAGGWLAAAFPRRVAYQHVLFLHQLFLFASVAVSRVAPVLFPPALDELDGIGVDVQSLAALVDRLDATARGLDSERAYACAHR
jgi:hypothetical protein